MQSFKVCVSMFPLGIALVFLSGFAQASAFTYGSVCDLQVVWFGPDQGLLRRYSPAEPVPDRIAAVLSWRQPKALTSVPRRVTSQRRFLAAYSRYRIPPPAWVRTIGTCLLLFSGPTFWKVPRTLTWKVISA